jgi:hypothetical protein
MFEEKRNKIWREKILRAEEVFVSPTTSGPGLPDGVF